MGKKILLLVSIVLLVGLLVLGGYLVLSKKSDLQTYENDRYGISFKYPANGQVKAISDTIDSSAINVQIPFTNQKQYVEWANRDFLVIIYHKSENKKNCENFSLLYKEGSNVVVNGRTYKFETSSPSRTPQFAGMNGPRYYATENSAYCYLFQESFNNGLGSDSAGKIKMSEIADLGMFFEEEFKDLDSIMNSIKISD